MSAQIAAGSAVILDAEFELIAVDMLQDNQAHNQKDLEYYHRMGCRVDKAYDNRSRSDTYGEDVIGVISRHWAATGCTGVSTNTLFKAHRFYKRMQTREGYLQHLIAKNVSWRNASRGIDENPPPKKRKARSIQAPVDPLVIFRRALIDANENGDFNFVHQILAEVATQVPEMGKMLAQSSKSDAYCRTDLLTLVRNYRDLNKNLINLLSA